ncbi:hypothetical protein FACS1894174_05700 [Bacteroidia bacterium]|nr:hypothetical protein FACS1894174_05700 [Bacteroidia bacterium]
MNGYTQQIDLNKPGDMISKDRLLKLNGGFSSSVVTYSGNELSKRDPFTYYLNGNLNLNIAGLLDLPFTFNFTNSGSNYTYPTMPNRLALHPMYKSLTGHFGDVAMSFSPYTLSGHQFTGAGLEFKSKNPLKVAVMYGRLQRAVEFGDGNRNIPAAYKRMGSGIKVEYEKIRYRLGFSLFSANDDENSIRMVPDSLGIAPQSNLAGSLSAGISLIDNMQFTMEYGVSFLNRDTRIPGGNVTDSRYNALKLLMNYTFVNNTVGIGYERIDPGYKTLGAYYFNNDLENITLNYARPFFNNKATIALSGGIEHDNLNKARETQTKRFVISADANYTHSERLNFNLNYSTFQTHTNIRSQFDYINELTPYDNLDTLNYTQLSQNMNLGINYMLRRSESGNQNLNLFLSYQEAADKQGDIIEEGALSRFYNASLGYGIQFVPQQINLNVNLNMTSNKMGGLNLFIVGPTLNGNVRYLDKKMSSGLVLSYNAAYDEEQLKSRVWNLRFNTSYLLMKKHNFSITAIYRKTDNPAARIAKTNGLTCTASYSYRF